MVAPVKNPVVTTGFKYVSKRRPSPWKAGYHPGIDYRAAIGTPTYAPVDSVIVNTRYDSAYGYKIVGECTVNGKKYQWIIAHHRKGGIHVKVGQRVKAGERIGSSGDTGNTFGAHVHFEARVRPFAYRNHVNPSVLINVKAGSASTDRMDPDAYFLDARGEHVRWLDERLIVHRFAKHHDGNGYQPGPTYTEFTRLNVRDFQLFQGWTGGGADGFPGKQTLALLAAEPDEELPPDTEGPVLEDPDTPLVLLARWAWTDTKNGRENRPLIPSKVASFTLHYPADGNVLHAGRSQSQIAQLLDGYREYHVEKKGWADIGYNYAIDGQGRTWFLTGDTIGAHADTVGNTTSIGVLLVLGNNEQPTVRMIEAFKVLYAEKQEKYPGIDGVRGHQDVPGNQTLCPGQPVMNAISEGLFTESPLPVPEPEPEPSPSPTPEPPQPPTETRFRHLNINLCADYCASTFGSRLDNMERVRDAARASLVGATECGSYADAERVNKAFGWGGKRNGTVETGESFVIHGGSVPITTGAHFNPNDWDVLDEGLWVTVPGTTHRWATWVLLRDNQTRDLLIHVTIHCQYLPKGPNTIRKYNVERFNQCDAAFEKIKDLQAKVLKSRPALGKVPAMLTGDVNGPRTDKKRPGGDGPGRAAAKHGYIDTAEVGPNDPAIIDRTFVRGMEVLESEVVPTNGATDHERCNTSYLSFNNRRTS